MIASQIWSHTDIGNGRSSNQDSVYANVELGLLLLADGMGGHNGGEVASQKTVLGVATQLEDAFEREHPIDHAGLAELINEAIQRQNRSLFNQAAQDPRLQGMGCTLVVVALAGQGAVIANVGDSRCYHITSGNIVQTTRDHNLAQVQLDSGVLTEEEVEVSSVRNLLTRAVGVAETVEVDLFEVTLEPGDHLITCSDGLVQPYRRAELESLIVSAMVDHDPAWSLVSQAVAAGSRDNVSVQVMRVDAN
jgi:protein phosphatase